MLKTNGSVRTQEKNGLVAPHAYSLLELARVHDRLHGFEYELVKLRNPWGEREVRFDWVLL